MISENLNLKNAPHCLLAVTVLTILLLGQHVVKGDTMSVCSSNPKKTMNIQCGPGYMLYILRSFYGYSQSGQCRLVADEEHHGCVEDDHVHYACVGRQSCDINLPPGDHGVNIKSCNKSSNYFQVDYKCVKESTVYDICSERRLMEESGYIRTPNYPSKFARQGPCNISIQADPSQQIRLHILDLQLQDKGHTDCYDYIYFRDTKRSYTLCGRRINTSYIMKSSLHIEVFSSRVGLSKGFWLHYEAFPPLPNSLQRPTPSKTNSNTANNNNNDNTNSFDNNWHSMTNSHLHEKSNFVNTEGNTVHNTEEEIHSRGNNPDNSVETTPVYKNNGNTVPLIRNKTRSSSSNLPFAAIAGGVIGTLSLILIILLLLLLIKWLRERRYFKAEKILEIRNPAFRSSGDFYEHQHQPQPQVPNNIHYYSRC